MKKSFGKKVQKKITIELPAELLDRALESSGEGIAGTVRRGLELLAASAAYERLHSLRGKIKFSLSLDQLRDNDR